MGKHNNKIGSTLDLEIFQQLYSKPLHSSSRKPNLECLRKWNEFTAHKSSTQEYINTLNNANKDSIKTFIQTSYFPFLKI